MIKTQGPDVTLEIAEAMVDEFEHYLLDDDLYRQLVVKTSDGDRMLKMSAGSLLETLQDLRDADEAGRLSSGQSAKLAELANTFEQLANRHAAAYRQKLARELKSQLDSWRWYLQDCHDNRSRCRDEYPFEVRIRNRIALLMDELGDDAPTDQVSRLQKLDRDLREMFAPGEFVLDPGSRGRYPEGRYWWLYGLPEPAE